MRKRLTAVLVGVVMLVGLGASPVHAAADPAGPSCQWWNPGSCEAATWYQDVRGLAMEQSADRLRRGVVIAYGPYLTSGNRSNIETWISNYGGSAAFRMCVRNEAVIFASRVATAKNLISSFRNIFTKVKGYPGAGTVSAYWKYGVEPLGKLAVTTTLISEASLSTQAIGGCH